MQSILNPFEIKIRKKSKVSYPITYEAFFPPIFKTVLTIVERKQKITWKDITNHVLTFTCYLFCNSSAVRRFLSAVSGQEDARLNCYFIFYFLIPEFLLFSVFFHYITKIKGGKIIFWSFGAPDHLNRTVFLQQ